MQDMISVITPVYNMADSIEKSVRSVLSQSYKNIEMLVVDDGSDDGTGEILARLAAEDSRLRVLKGQHQGSGVARGLALEEARGEFAAFLDGDDEMQPGALQAFADAADGTCDLVQANYARIYEDGRRQIMRHKNGFRTGDEIRMHFDQYLNTGADGLQISSFLWEKMFSLRVIRENNVQFPACKRMQDAGFIARYLCYTQAVRFIDTVVIDYTFPTFEGNVKIKPQVMLDSAIETHKCMVETMLSWNPQNVRLVDKDNAYYVDKVLAAIQLTYHKQHGYTWPTRRSFVKKALQDTGLCSLKVTGIRPSYRWALWLYSHHMYFAGTQILHSRMFIKGNSSLRSLYSKLKQSFKRKKR